ncbi:DUF4183 domain-containing protein [Cohnella fermenti]|uniref:DUF4183 domain-containing protein n=1 Tax=Cohnella fermenti TaxID=2565925 RepID=UPI001454D8B8|nr:DUF4183 domain-containing protein [Cohnella fermenti]
MRTSTTLYYAVADGVKRIYTDKDGAEGYGCNRIPNPASVSLINVFVNGMLQPRTLYRIQTGKLRLLSDDLPAEGVPIIVQSIRIKG